MDPSIRFSLLGFGKWFGTVGTVLAFISVAKPQHRAQVRAMLVPAALVAILAGITEPFEFMYLWASPILFVVNAALDGLFQCILFASGFRALLTGFIRDRSRSPSPFPAELSQWFMVIPVGAVAIVAWFLVFRFLILKLNLVTPVARTMTSFSTRPMALPAQPSPQVSPLRAFRSSSMASAVRRTSRAS